MPKPLDENPPSRGDRGSRRDPDPTPSRRGAPEPASRRGSPAAPESRRSREPEPESTASTTTGIGWGPVANRKKEVADRFEESNGIREFWLRDGESAMIQFLDDAPLCIDGHNILNGEGKWAFEPCQLLAQRHCLMCRDKIKKGWKAYFKIIDYRGTWDKGTEEFLYDKEDERYWSVGSTVAEQLEGIITAKGRKLSTMVFIVRRTGEKKNTSYNFEMALDRDDRVIRPITDWEDEYDPLTKIIVPKTDAELEKRGFSQPEYDNKKGGGSGRTAPGARGSGSRGSDRGTGSRRGADPGAGRSRHGGNDDLPF